MSKVTAYEQVQAARDASKISIQTLIDGLTEDFFDCHGDRQRADDPAVIAGLANPVACSISATVMPSSPATNNSPSICSMFVMLFILS